MTERKIKYALIIFFANNLIWIAMCSYERAKYGILEYQSAATVEVLESRSIELRRCKELLEEEKSARRSN